MAAKKAVSTRTKKEQYVTHTSPTSISATSRIAIKVRENYYTIEAHEERSITEQEGLNLDLEWKMLFESVNKVVDEQAEEISNCVNK